ncbi:MAG TPA: cysteine peptidase family C39 domain-containing protein [Alphaproteobacteria bacterium]|nr:cysteine peptidase family C39 domain-containing protein [Alphaproteobacteria bacterium]
MKIIQFPQLRQSFDYDCGAEALRGILGYYGIDEDLGKIIKEAKTTEKHGTQFDGIIRVLKKHNLRHEFKSMTVIELEKYLDKNIPVIIELQAWPEKKKADLKESWDNSHFVIAIGYTDNEIIFEDPAVLHKTSLAFNDLMDRWHSTSTKRGKTIKHENMGVAVFGEPKYAHNNIIRMR